MNANRKKIEKAIAKRKEAQRVRPSSASSGWVKDRVTNKTHPIISDLQQYYIDATVYGQQFRDTEHVHASDIVKGEYCLRQVTYRIEGTEPDDGYDPDKIFWRLASIFEEGNEIHEKHQKAFWEMGTLYGVWKCIDCGERWWAQSPVVCSSCGAPHIEFKEVPIEHPDYHLIGHTDGIHIDDEGVHRNLEMKSVGIRTIEIEIPDIYRRWREAGEPLSALLARIKVPLPSHQRQGQIYMAVLRHMGFDIDETVFIYEFKATQELKGFVVRYNEKAALNLLNRATLVLKALESGELPDRPKWADKKSWGCKDCPYTKRCWS